MKEKKFDKFFRSVVDGFCPLNPPFWGTLNRNFWLEVPQNGGFRGLPEFNNEVNHFRGAELLQVATIVLNLHQ
jgi:hypothetical protein